MDKVNPISMKELLMELSYSHIPNIKRVTNKRGESMSGKFDVKISNEENEGRGEVDMIVYLVLVFGIKGKWTCFVYDYNEKDTIKYIVLNEDDPVQPVVFKLNENNSWFEVKEETINDRCIDAITFENYTEEKLKRYFMVKVLFDIPKDSMDPKDFKALEPRDEKLTEESTNEEENEKPKEKEKPRRTRTRKTKTEDVQDTPVEDIVKETTKGDVEKKVPKRRGRPRKIKSNE